MKPVFKDGKLTVELHKPEIQALQKARTIGQSLQILNQDSGLPLVEAIDAILEPEKPFEDD